MMCHFIMLALIRLIFLVFSLMEKLFLQFSSGTGFGFTILLVILFPINSPVASAILWTTFLEAVFAASNPVFVAVSNNFFPYC